MSPAPSRWRGLWALAAALSLGLHGAAVAALVWQPNWGTPPPAAPPQPLRLDVAAPTRSQAPAEVLTAAAPAETLHPVTDAPLPQARSDAITPAEPGPEAAPESPPESAPESAREPDPALAPILDQPEAVILNPLPDALTAAPSLPRVGVPASVGTALPAAAPRPAAPQDPRIAELFELIRSRLTQACLYARPALLGDDEIQLSVFASDDRQIAALMRELTAAVETPVTQHEVLLDPRQCPTLAFARRDPAYPAPGLSLQLDAQDLQSGQDLTGRVAGGAGLYTTLLLIDDAGVVHDLRRFLVGSAAGSRFEIPLARFGDPRDTHQLLIAIATPRRPDAVTRHAGALAETFFDALGAELGQDLRAGLASVYVR